MFESEKSRKDFLIALKAGKISPTLLQKAIAHAKVFAACPQEEVAWTLNHSQPLIQQFGQAIMAANKGPDSGNALVDQFLKERVPAKIEQLAQSLAANPPSDLNRQLSMMANDKNIETRQKAVTLLVKLPDWPRQKALVNVFLEDPKPAVSDTMLKHVVRTAPRIYMKVLRKNATHENEEMRTLCLKTLVTMNNIKHADILVERLAQETGELQKSLYGALASFIKNEPEGMTEVIAHALGSPVDSVRSAALNLLLKLPDQKAAFSRLLMFGESVSAMLRDQLYSEMARSADAWVDHVLAVFKTEKNPALRLQAMNLAKLLKHQRLAPVFLHEMKNGDWMTRYSAMQVLGEMKSQQALPLLVEALNNEESIMAAVQALDKYRDVRVAKPLLGKLSSAGESAQIEILKVLRNMGDPRLLPPMAKFLDSSAPKGKAKKAAADTVIGLCEDTKTAVPEKVRQIYESLREKTVDDLPDLGLRLSLD